MAIQFFMFMNLATLFVVVVQSLSRVQLLATPWTAARKPSLSIISRSLLILMSIELVMPSNHLALCHPLLLLPSIFPSIRVFSNESALCIRWPKFWSFSLSISPSNEYSGLISFRMDWLDLLAVQETLKSLLQHCSSKANMLLKKKTCFSSVQLVMSDSLQPHGLQHARLSYPSPTPGAYSNLCPSSWWCHLIISPSVVPFSSHLQSFPASGSFQMNQFFASGGQSIGPLPDSPQ